MGGVEAGDRCARSGRSEIEGSPRVGGCEQGQDSQGGDTYSDRGSRFLGRSSLFRRPRGGSSSLCMVDPLHDLCIVEVWRCHPCQAVRVDHERWRPLRRSMANKGWSPTDRNTLRGPGCGLSPWEVVGDRLGTFSVWYHRSGLLGSWAEHKVSFPGETTNLSKNCSVDPLLDSKGCQCWS